LVETDNRTIGWLHISYCESTSHTAESIFSHFARPIKKALREAADKITSTLSPEDKVTKTDVVLSLPHAPILDSKHFKT
jgi:hypothetical protein